MFTLHHWPKPRNRTGTRTGRPKSTHSTSSKRPKNDSELEQLLVGGHISEQQFRTALWYQKAWHLYISAIKAPRVKTTTHDVSTIRGEEWHLHDIIKIESNWKRAQEILASHDLHIRRSVNQVICLNQPCRHVIGLRRFLTSLEKQFRLFSN